MFTIKAISGNNITLDRPAQWLHWGANDEYPFVVDLILLIMHLNNTRYAEVALLTRNVLIQGDNSSDASLYGGHVIVFGNGTGKVQGTFFFCK